MNVVSVRRRAAVVGLLLGALVVGAVPSASASLITGSLRSGAAAGDGGLAPIPLTRSVVISTQGNGYVPVRLLKAVSFAGSGDAPHATLSVDGGGGFAGVALVQDGAATPAALLAGRIDRALSCSVRCVAGSGGIVVRSQNLARGGDAVNSPHLLPAGVYRMYLLSTSGPASVRLTMPELPGVDGTTQELVSYTYTGARVALPQNLAPAGQRSLYYAGTSGEIATTGMLFTYTEVVGEASPVGQTYTCRYDGGTTHPASYAPRCPGGTADVGDPVVNPTASPLGFRSTRHSFFANVAPGTYGLGGGYVTTSNSIDTANTVAVWLSY